MEVRSIDYYEIFKDQLTSYSLFDLSSIKQNKTIKTAKDLEKEGKAISDVLKDLKSKFFHLRIYAIRK